MGDPIPIDAIKSVVLLRSLFAIDPVTASDESVACLTKPGREESSREEYLPVLARAASLRAHDRK